MRSIALFLLFFVAGLASLTLLAERSAKSAAENQNQINNDKQTGPVTFSVENAPSQSLHGQISEITGSVMWQGRTATQASAITNPQEVQQGESMTTGDDGTATVTFPSASTIDVGNDTDVAIVQTLPKDNVFAQDGGTATYTKAGQTPVSIRSNILLVEIASGTATITFDKIRPIITVDEKNGTATAAYNDLQYLSHEQEIDDGHSFIFNYETTDSNLE